MAYAPRLPVRRSDGRQFASFCEAYHMLLGKRGEELGNAEHKRMRFELRMSNSVRDRHGFLWYKDEHQETEP